MNKYLEKVAEFYQVEPHSSDKDHLGIKHVSLNRGEVDSLGKRKSENYHVAPAIGSGALGGALGRYVGEGVGEVGRRAMAARTLAKHGPNKFIEFARNTRGMVPAAKLVGTVYGIDRGLKAYDRHVHNKSMEQAGLSSFSRRHKND